MKYKVSVNYMDFEFTDREVALDFAETAKMQSTDNVRVSIEFTEDTNE